jgi:hypothetical protein
VLLYSFAGTVRFGLQWGVPQGRLRALSSDCSSELTCSLAHLVLLPQAFLQVLGWPFCCLPSLRTCALFCDFEAIACS